MHQGQNPPLRDKKTPDLKPNRPLYPLLFILAVTSIVYIPALFNGFVLWDDHSYTWENPFLKNFSFPGVFSFTAYFQGNYHPLTLLWLHLEWLVFPAGNPGMYGGLNPFWFHANNIVLHVMNTALVFWLVYELLDKKDWKAAAVTALLFGIHPMHVESVAWVSELKDVLYSLFYLGAALVYIRFVKKKKSGLLILSFSFFILSNLAKGQAVTLPALLLLIDYWFGRRPGWKMWLEKIPFFAGSVLFGWLAIRSQASVSALNSDQAVSFSSIFNASYGLLVYLYKTIIPLHLAAVHPYLYKGMNFRFYFYLFPLVVVVLTALFIRTTRYTKDYIFGFLFFLVTISVMIKLVPVGDSLVNERYSYIPYIGLFFMIGRSYSTFSDQKKWRIISYSLLFVFCVALSVMTVKRIGVWKDTATFWSDVISKYPDYWRGYYGMGVLTYNASDFDQSFKYAGMACDRHPPAAPYMLRGTIYLKTMKNTDAAMADFKKVLTFHEKDSPFERDARFDLGRIYLGKGQFPEAITILDEAISIAPDDAHGYVLRAKAFTGMKKYTDAENDYTKAIRADINDADAYLARGMLYTDYLGQYEKGISDFKKVLELVPGQNDAELGIGFSYFKMNHAGEAIKVYDQILRLRPEEGRVYYFRALAYASQSRFRDACRDGLKAVESGFHVNDAELNFWKSKAE